jgi:hypothetical protein
MERAARKLGGWRGGHPFARRRVGAELDHQLKEAARVLAGERPVCLALYQGRNRGWELAFVQAARQAGVDTVVLCLAEPGVPPDLAQVRGGPGHAAGNLPSVVRRWPRQFAARPDTGELVSFYGIDFLQEAAARDALPPNPWVPGGNACDRVLVSGRQEAERLTGYGADTARLVVTGHPAHDDLHRLFRRREELESELRRRYSLGTEGLLIVAALPQYGEHRMLPWDRHWQEIDRLIRALAATGAPCLISLHPRMDPERYRFLEADRGLPVATEPLARLLPAAGLFVSTLSTTLKWAVLCGVPAVGMNFLGQPEDSFAGLAGVRLLADPELLGPELQGLAGDPGLRQRLAAEQRHQAERLSPFDGRCTERVLSSMVG